MFVIMVFYKTSENSVDQPKKNDFIGYLKDVDHDEIIVTRYANAAFIIDNFNVAIEMIKMLNETSEDKLYMVRSCHIYSEWKMEI